MFVSDSACDCTSDHVVHIPGTTVSCHCNRMDVNNFNKFVDCPMWLSGFLIRNEANCDWN